MQFGNNSTSTSKPATNYRWQAMFLTAGIIAVAYVDRVNFAVATPTLMKLFELGPAQMGVLMSAFFWPYMVSQMPSGWLVNRVGSKLVVFWSCFGWGVTTALTALVSGFYSFLAVRVLLGVTEAPGFPAAARVVSVWIPAQERTTASALFDAAARAGNAFCMPFVVWLLVQYGWKASFVITGGLAVLYSFIWLKFYHEPDDHPKVSESELAYIRQDEIVSTPGDVEKTAAIPLLKLFTYGRFNLMCLGYFQYAYFWTAYSMWVPSFLVQAKGFSLEAMGFAAMWPYIIGFFAELGGGLICDGWRKRGGTLTQIRRFGTVTGFVGAALGLIIVVNSSSNMATIVGLSIAMGGISFGAANFWAIPNDLAPYGQGGGFAGAMNFVGQIGCLIAPMVSGFVIGTAWGYDGMLYIMTGSAIVGALAYALNNYDKKIVAR